MNFNPRPRKEGDTSFCNGGRSGSYFNPRPRKEGDRYTNTPRKFLLLISIHALVKRATTLTVTGAAIADISIHALVKRATKAASCS